MDYVGAPGLAFDSLWGLWIRDVQWLCLRDLGQGHRVLRPQFWSNVLELWICKEHTYAHIHVCMYVCMYVYIYRERESVCVCMHTRTHTHTHIYIYMFTHTS